MLDGREGRRAEMRAGGRRQGWEGIMYIYLDIDNVELISYHTDVSRSDFVSMAKKNHSGKSVRISSCVARNCHGIQVLHRL